MCKLLIIQTKANSAYTIRFQLKKYIRQKTFLLRTHQQKQASHAFQHKIRHENFHTCVEENVSGQEDFLVRYIGS
jgi:hypothetical protein